MERIESGEEDQKGGEGHIIEGNKRTIYAKL